MRIAVAATPSVALPTLDWLLKSEHELVFVISRPDSPSGRGKHLRPSEVSKWCAEHGVQLLKPTEIETVVRPLSKVDLLITIGFGLILPTAVYQSPRRGSINLHFSLLPAWRGAAPVQRGIEAGDAQGGVSVFALDDGMDTGPLYVQRRMDFPSHKCAGEILVDLSQLGALAIRDSIEMIANSQSPIPQPSRGASRARKVTKEDARIDWRLGAIDIERKIRAFSPEPGAWSTWRDRPIQISKVILKEKDSELSPAEVGVRDGSIYIGCGGESALEILEVTPSGKRRMDSRSWANGARITLGESFV